MQLSGTTVRPRSRMRVRGTHASEEGRCTRPHGEHARRAKGECLVLLVGRRGLVVGRGREGYTLVGVVLKIQGARRWRAAVAPRYRIVCAARMCDCESEAEPDAPLIRGTTSC